MKTLGRAPQNELSHVKGDENTPLLNLTITELLAQTTEKWSDHTAAVFPAQNI